MLYFIPRIDIKDLYLLLMFVRVVRELMEPVECPERLDQRHDQQLIIFISDKISIALILRCTLTFLLFSCRATEVSMDSQGSLARRGIG